MEKFPKSNKIETDANGAFVLPDEVRENLRATLEEFGVRKRGKE